MGEIRVDKNGNIASMKNVRIVSIEEVEETQIGGFINIQLSGKDISENLSKNMKLVMKYGLMD